MVRHFKRSWTTFKARLSRPAYPRNSESILLALREGDGKIHSDSKTKLITALIYMNDAWESPTGRLRLLRSAQNLDDIVAEVPPERGTLLMFKNVPNAWHGFESFSGPRRVVQLNWVTDQSVVQREQSRHRRSAFFKRLLGRLS
jgi:SM-20-related protein